jgi:hypothetical protein
MTKILIKTSSLNSTTIVSPEKNYHFVHVWFFNYFHLFYYNIKDNYNLWKIIEELNE